MFVFTLCVVCLLRWVSLAEPILHVWALSCAVFAEFKVEETAGSGTVIDGSLGGAALKQTTYKSPAAVS